MSNFDIQYNFIAIDRFTKVAKRVQKEVAKIDKMMNKGSKSFERQSVAVAKTSNHIDKAAKKLKTLGTVTTDVAKKTNLGMNSIVKGLKKGGKSFSEITERVAKLGDTLAFKGYIQFMNIGLPIMLAGKMGLDYADQIEGATTQMDTLFGKQKNYAMMSKQINTQAAQLSKHSRFTQAEIKATSAHIGVMTNNLKLAKDLTPLALKYAALEQIAPAQAADKILAAIRAGGAVAGTGMVLPKGVGSEMAQKRYLMLQKELGGKLTGILAKDANTAGAALHKMMGQLQKTAGVILINATPALHTIGAAMNSIVTPLINFMNAHKTMTGDFVKGALMAMTFTTGITLLGAAISAIAMPFEMLIKTIRILRTVYLAAAAAAKVLGIANVQSAAGATAEAAAGGAGGVAGKRGVLGMVAKGAMGLGVLGGSVVAAGLLAAAAGGYYVWTHPKAQKRLGQTGAKLRQQFGTTFSPLRSEEAQLSGYMPSTMAGSLTTLGLGKQEHLPRVGTHIIEMNVNVNQEGKVTGVHATSPSQFLMNVALGTNMVHTHG